MNQPRLRWIFESSYNSSSFLSSEMDDGMFFKPLYSKCLQDEIESNKESSDNDFKDLLWAKHLSSKRRTLLHLKSLTHWETSAVPKTYKNC